MTGQVVGGAEGTHCVYVVRLAPLTLLREQDISLVK